jgi:hypothetical protein
MKFYALVMFLTPTFQTFNVDKFIDKTAETCIIAISTCLTVLTITIVYKTYLEKKPA